MNTDHFVRNLKKRGNIQAEIGVLSSDDQIKEIESKLGVNFPEQVKLFYSACNGLKTNDPALEIKSLSELVIEQSKIEFAVINKQHSLSFDLSGTNDAGQWDIINSKTKFIVTKTMASFWSNKIFAWLDKRRPIWQEEAC